MSSFVADELREAALRMNNAADGLLKTDYGRALTDEEQFLFTAAKLLNDDMRTIFDA